MRLWIEKDIIPEIPNLLDYFLDTPPFLAKEQLCTERGSALIILWFCVCLLVSMFHFVKYVYFSDFLAVQWYLTLNDCASVGV